MTVSRILDLHAEVAALAWLRRDRTASQPHFRLNNPFKPDGRLDAHLDGLCIAEAGAANATWEVCLRELRWQEPGAVEQADLVALAVAGAVGEVAGAAAAVPGAFGILRAEAREAVHGDAASRHAIRVEVQGIDEEVLDIL
jgi:hypothetical protein